MPATDDPTRRNGPEPPKPGLPHASREGALLVPRRIAGPAMALAAASVLSWEILLTRLASLRYHFHFGFLAVSLGLLGMGASGALLALWAPRWRVEPLPWLRRLSLGYVWSLTLGAVGLYVLQVHQGSMDLWGSTSFAIFVLLGGLPFLAGGGFVGLLLGADPGQVNERYGIDLLAAGLGCTGILHVLETLGAGGALAVVLAAAAAVTGLMAGTGWQRRAWFTCAICLLAMASVVDSLLPAPSKITRPILQSTWTRLARVDQVQVPDDSRTVRARGRPVDPRAVPPQVELTQDGSASTLLTDYTHHPKALALLDDTLFSASVRLRPGADVLVIGVGGGDDVWAALRNDASHVLGVDLHEPIVAAHAPGGRGWTAAWGDRVDLEVAEGRRLLMRDRGHYDVVQMTGIDTWAAVTSGAYALVENNLYTTEAFSYMLDRLAPGGILQVTRMAAEMEALRVLSHVDAASTSRRTVPFERSVMVLGSADHQVATMMRLDGFSDVEVSSTEIWARWAGLELLHLPGREIPGLISTFIRSQDRQAFIRAFPRNISPTHDDSPYFFNFTRWTRPALAAATIREPSYISQGNPLFILGHLAVCSSFAALALLLSHKGKGTGPRSSWGSMLYFAMVGLGFIGIELGLMQKLTLLLGHPLLSLSITLTGLLLSSGCGALLSGRWALDGWRVWSVPVGIALWVTALLLGLPVVVTATIAWPVWARCLLALAMLAPGGLLLGIPFAWGLARVRPDMVLWAWAVNGFFTVTGSVLTVLVSMVLGFSWVLWGSTLAYLLAFASWRMQSTKPLQQRPLGR